MKNCCVCESSAIITLLDLGIQPICNRYIKCLEEKYNRPEEEYKHPLVLGLCKACGLIQLLNPVSATELIPKYSWVTYREPEDHLDRVMEMLLGLPNLNKESSICGISFKDVTLLERFKQKGFKKVIQLNPREDLDVRNNQKGAETIQCALNTKTASSIVKKKGKFDLVIIRHLLEHAYNVKEFILAARILVKDTGYVMFEVPSSTKLLEHFDYSCIWEEHLVYFTAETFKNCLSSGRFLVHNFECFPFSIEDCLVAIVKPNEKDDKKIPEEETLKKENDRALSFSTEFQKKKNTLITLFSEINKTHGKIVFFGAGHNACIFINIFGIKNNIACLIDDNKNKQGYLMPGSHLPIVSSSELINKNIKLSIFSLNPDIEKKIVEDEKEFRNKGGTFLSICPTSKLSIYNSSILENKKFEKNNEEVYYVKDKLVKLEKDDIQLFKKKAICNLRERCRVCTHKDIDDTVHEMLIVHKKNTYIRPHKHLLKPESVHILEGFATAIIFDDKGKVIDVVEMGDYHSGKKFYYRLNNSHYHTLLINSDFIVFHEVTRGPFQKSETLFAPWSPEENDEIKIKEFIKELEEKINKTP